MSFYDIEINYAIVYLYFLIQRLELSFNHLIYSGMYSFIDHVFFTFRIAEFFVNNFFFIHNFYIILY